MGSPTEPTMSDQEIELATLLVRGLRGTPTLVSDEGVDLLERTIGELRRLRQQIAEQVRQQREEEERFRKLAEASLTREGELLVSVKVATLHHAAAALETLLGGTEHE